jgi:hypothetical protein
MIPMSMRTISCYLDEIKKKKCRFKLMINILVDPIIVLPSGVIAIAKSTFASPNAKATHMAML